MEWVRSHRIATVLAEGMKLQKLEHLPQRLRWLPPRSVCVCVEAGEGGQETQSPYGGSDDHWGWPGELSREGQLPFGLNLLLLFSAAPTHTLFTDGRSESILLLPALTGSKGLHLTTAPGDSERL